MARNRRTSNGLNGRLPVVFLAKWRPSVLPGARCGAPSGEQTTIWVPVFDPTAGCRAREIRLVIACYCPEEARRDVADWLAIQNSAFAGRRAGKPWGERHFRREVTARAWWSPRRLWIARLQEEDGRTHAVGTVALEVRADEGQVHWMAVAADYQRCGLGRQLLGHVEAVCWREPVRRLLVETERGTAAEAFYRRCGFAELPTAPRAASVEPRRRQE